ncbi:MAG: hypothetical protein JSR43_05300 [Proteobacteria bacterium]|nr:hypothetical protein [Pseudomonadota bacterium]
MQRREGEVKRRRLDLSSWREVMRRFDAAAPLRKFLRLKLGRRERECFGRRPAAPVATPNQHGETHEVHRL